MASNDTQAKFLDGSILRHIVVMSSSGAVGLMALFLVDLLDMFFISLLGEVELAAAIGFAGTIVFFSTSVSIGTSIAMGALVSRALGAGKRNEARILAGNVVLLAFLISTVFVIAMLIGLDSILSLIGATGETAEKAKDYLVILLPSAPFLAMGMAGGAALRGVGDAKRSMSATLVGGCVNAVLDPIFIFGLSMGVEGAAIASVMARIVIVGVSFYALVKHHDLLAKPTLPSFISSIKPVSSIALPAIVTNTATPLGNAIVTSQIAAYGQEYVAGYAVIGRLLPVTFGLIFSLSGAVGPIMGQNFGAGRLDRVKATVTDSLKFATAYCIAISIVMFALQDAIIAVFSLSGEAASMVSIFCTYIAVSFIFNGMLFVSNAAFNNLNRPTWSTLLNVGKATLGTIPFVYFGGQLGGAEGVLVGQAVGSVVFGLLGYIVVSRLIRQLADENEKKQAVLSIEPSMPLTPFTSCREHLADDIDVAEQDAEREKPAR